MTDNACAELARVADAIAADHPSPDDFLAELGHRVAGIRPGWLSTLGLIVGGRSRITGGGFRAELRDHTATQARHFAGIARSVTLLGAGRTEWLSVHVRRDAADSPDGRLTGLAIAFAEQLLDGSLEPQAAGAWIRSHVCE